MSKMKVHSLLVFCFLICVFTLSIRPASAVSQTIVVEAEQEKVEPVSLNAEDEISGRISVVGGANDDIDFYIMDPVGEAVLPKEKVSVKDFRFTASRGGTYELHFDNSFSTERKTVSFNYDVRHYIFGIPQEDFLVFLVMIVAMIGLVLFAALSRP